MAGKLDLVDRIAEQEAVPKGLAKRLVDSMFSQLAELLEDGQEVQIRGFGTFRQVTMPARKAHDPRNREPVHLPERQVVKFKSVAKH